MNRAVFFDRDNTIIKDLGYLNNPEYIEFLEGAVETIKTLYDNNFRIIIITNQSGVGRGLISEQGLQAVHNRLTELLKTAGAHITAIYHCPHRPDDGCICRKPNPYLIYKAAREHNIDLSRSFFVGNEEKDMYAGKNAGLTTVSVFFENPTDETPGDYHAKHLGEAMRWILKNAQ